MLMSTAQAKDAIPLVLPVVKNNNNKKWFVFIIEL